MKHLRSKIALPVLLFLFAFLTPFTLSPSHLSDIISLAPVEIVAEGFQEPTGVVVDQSGAIFVSDRKSGEIFKIVGAAVGPIVTHLQRPVGLEFDREGRLLIVEEKTGRLRRLEGNGSLTILAQGMKNPRWVAMAEDETIYLSAKGLKSQGDKEDNDDEEQSEVILRVTHSGQLTVFASGFKGLQGIVVSNGDLFAAAKGLKQEKDDDGGVFKIRILPDGSAGPISRLTQSEIKKPFGLALDILDALYVSAEEIELEKKAKDAIGKIASSGALTRFASGLEEPRGLALDSFGNLYVADDKGDEKGRIIRFRAPPPPTVVYPSFTNQSQLTLHGTTEPNSRIDAFLNDAVTRTVFTQDGAFELILDLVPNAENLLHAFTTVHSGQGLTSAPAEVTIVHDGLAPGVAFSEPAPGSFVRHTVSVQAQANDGGSGIASFALGLNGQPLPATATSALPSDSVTASSLWNTTTDADGTYILQATATDRAGNTTTVTRSVVVDNTPPDTQIVSGPEGTISATSVVFTVSGTDNPTPSGDLQFAWRLDGGPFSPFSPQTQVSFTGLSPGPHTFEVKARDLAGNEDPTPAQRTFTISTLQVLITDPADSATVNAGNLLVRGTVEAGGVEVGITVNGFPAAVQGNAFAALIPVSPETTSLTAVATNAAGITASHGINISVVAAPEPAFSLLVSPQGGVAPLTVSFLLLGGAAVSSIDLDFDGDGSVDFTGTSLEGQAFTYTQPGIYVPTVTVTDTRGNRLSASAVVQVFDRVALDVLLQAKWTGMKDALREGDIEGALTFVSINKRESYRRMLNALGSTITDIDQILTGLSFVGQRGVRAEYQMVRVENGVRISYFVLFVPDEDGIWRLKFF